MIAQFRTADNQLFVIDVDGGKWYTPSAPLTLDNNDNLVVPEGTEQGELTPHGFGAYALTGREPKNEDGTPNLVMVGFQLVPVDRTLHVVMEANVPIKDRTALKPIESVRYIGREDVKNEEPGSEGPSGAKESSDGGTEPAGATGEEQPATEAGVESNSEGVGA